MELLSLFRAADRSSPLNLRSFYSRTIALYGDLGRLELGTLLIDTTSTPING